MIVVTLVCAYLACWGPTKKRGIEDVEAFALSTAWDTEVRDNPHLAMHSVSIPKPYAAIPLAVVVDGWDSTRHYYFWFFGYVAKLPYERELQ